MGLQGPPTSVDVMKRIFEFIAPIYHVAIQKIPHAIAENLVAKLRRGVCEVSLSRGRAKHSHEDLGDTNIGYWILNPLAVSQPNSTDNEQLEMVRMTRGLG